MVMKQNCERMDRINSSTKQVKLLAACSKAFISLPSKAKPEGWVVSFYPSVVLPSFNVLSIITFHNLYEVYGKRLKL